MTRDQAQRITDSIQGLIYTNAQLHEAYADPDTDPKWILKLAYDVDHTREELTRLFKWLEAPQWAT